MKKNLPSARLDKFSGACPRHHWQLVLALCFVVFTSSAQFRLVKDINTEAADAPNEFSHIIDGNGIVYFVMRGNELWKSNGTTAGTVRIKKLSSITGLKYAFGLLFMVASDSVSGSELWKSDGTSAGTIRLKDIAPGAISSSPASLVAVDNTLYFIANDGKKGKELYKTDGTLSGTVLVKDIMKGGGHCNCRDLISFNSKLYFVANGSYSGYEVWVSDGTATGTHIFIDIGPGRTSSSPGNLTAAPNAFYFNAKDPLYGQEVWKSDGTVSGTALLKDIYPGTLNSFPSNFITVNNDVYFRASDGLHGYELWKTNGTESGTNMVIDLVKGKTSGFSWVHGMAAVNDLLYYVIGRTVYRTDGTAAGTSTLYYLDDFYEDKEIAVLNNDFYVVDNAETNSLLKFNSTGVSLIDEVIIGENSWEESTHITKVGNFLYLTSNNNPDKNFVLLQSDGTTAGTVKVFEGSKTTGDSNPNGLTDVNGTLYFNAFAGSNSSNGLWKCNGTDSSTSLVRNFDEIYSQINYNSLLIFSAMSDGGKQLWKSDGTEEGTVMIKEFAYWDYPTDFINFNNEIYFRADDQDSGQELWKTDGTPEGTVLVKDINTTGFFNQGSFPVNFTIAGNYLLFSADDGIHGSELWKTDGTEQGTALVKDNTPGIDGSVTYNYNTLNGVLYFLQQGDTNTSLWKSDGTSDGTTIITTLNPLQVLDLKTMNGSVYVVAYNPNESNNNALWKIDQAGIVTKVHDIYPGAEIISLAATLDNKLYMTVSYYSLGYVFELWVTDGTTDGTMKLTNKNTINGYVINPVPFNHILYFYDNSYQPNLIRTDGTVCGTYPIAGSWRPSNVTVSANTLFVTLPSGNYGRELFTYDPGSTSPPCTQVARLIPDETNITTLSNTADEALITNYPNPFKMNFSLHVNGNETDQPYQASIIHLNGTRLESYTGLKRNVDYQIGRSLGNGLYVLRVVIDGKVITKRISKFN